MPLNYGRGANATTRTITDNFNVLEIGGLMCRPRRFGERSSEFVVCASYRGGKLLKVQVRSRAYLAFEAAVAKAVVR